MHLYYLFYSEKKLRDYVADYGMFILTFLHFLCLLAGLEFF